MANKAQRKARKQHARNQKMEHGQTFPKTNAVKKY